MKKKMKTKPVDDVFYYLSKATIIIPLVVLLIALIIKFNEKPKTQSYLEQPIIQPTIQVKVESDLLKNFIKTNASSSASFDLTGPLNCDYQYDGGVVNAQIKNNNILLKANTKSLTQAILYKGDCIYLWTPGKLSGQKICGVSSYISTLNALSGFGNFSLDSILKYLPSLGIPVKNVSSKDIAGIINSCKKKEVNSDIFTIPQNILFKNGL